MKLNWFVKLPNEDTWINREYVRSIRLTRYTVFITMHQSDLHTVEFRDDDEAKKFVKDLAHPGHDVNTGPK